MHSGTFSTHLSATSAAMRWTVFAGALPFRLGGLRRVFDEVRRLRLPVKVHPEQRSNLGGATLAASYGALSADPLEYLDEERALAMARAKTVAVLLLGAFDTSRE